MKFLYLHLENDCSLGAMQIKVADTFWQRFCGLMGTKSLPQNVGLLILPCNSVHMIGMRYAIDVIYLDENNQIIKVVENLQPWGFSMCCQAKSTLEVAAGTVQRVKLCVGDRLGFTKNDQSKTGTL